MMETKTQNGIVYLFGAGASAQALPIVTQMEDRLKVFFVIISLYKQKKNSDEEKYDTTKVDNLILGTADLLNDIKGHRSIDTYAKKLFLENPKTNPKLDNLKAVLGTYLTFEEMTKDDDLISFIRINGKYGNHIEVSLFNHVYNLLDGGSMQKKNIDQRYINFLLDVVSDRDKFPEKIKIFSWNYDSQILLATKILNFDAISRTRNIYEKKLNGEAVSDIISPIFNILEGVEVGEACNESADLYWRLMSSSDSDKKTRDNLRVRFAFEQNVENFVEKSSFLSSFQRITDVIIVGYSFPFSNREVDNNIFKAILGKSNIGDYGGKLNIYIQTPDKETFDTSRGKVASTLISINGQIKDDGRVLIYEPYQGRSSQIIIEHKWDRDNFYIPQTF